MKLNKVMFFFSLTLISSVAMRFLQLYFTIETKTGFYTAESGNYGPVLLILIFVFCLATAVFALFAHNKPENPPEGNAILSIAAFLLAFSVFYEVMFETLPVSVVLWQVLLLKVSGIATAIYLLLFAISPVLKFHLPAVLSTIPTVYLISRLICDFTTISKLALISDNIIHIATYCVLLLFMLNFAKLYNKADDERNFKKLLSTGLTSVILCFTNSVPYIVFNVANGYGYMHTTISANVSVLLFGVFILAFLLSHFSRKNLEN